MPTFKPLDTLRVVVVKELRDFITGMLLQPIFKFASELGNFINNHRNFHISMYAIVLFKPVYIISDRVKCSALMFLYTIYIRSTSTIPQLYSIDPYGFINAIYKRRLLSMNNNAECLSNSQYKTCHFYI